MDGLDAQTTILVIDKIAVTFDGSVQMIDCAECNLFCTPTGSWREMEQQKLRIRVREVGLQRERIELSPMPRSGYRQTSIALSNVNR